MVILAFISTEIRLIRAVIVCAALRPMQCKTIKTAIGRWAIQANNLTNKQNQLCDWRDNSECESDINESDINDPIGELNEDTTESVNDYIEIKEEKTDDGRFKAKAQFDGKIIFLYGSSQLKRTIQFPTIQDYKIIHRH